MQIKKYETKDRYGNSKSFEFFEGSADMEVPGMTDMPDHPGEPKGTDTVPAWLTPGEFVINKEATGMYGPLLKNINDEGRKMQSGEQHDHPSEAMYAAEGDIVPDTPMSQYEMYQYIKSLGFEENAAKGIMSNIRHEAGSGFDPSTVQKTDEGNPVRYGGMGLFQWEKGNLKRRILNEDTGVLELKPKGGRFDTDPVNLLKFAKEKNRNWTDPKTQIDFMNHEMRPQADDVADKDWRAWAQLRVDMNNAATPGEAAQLFAKKYERHAGNPQVARTTWADNDENFFDPNMYTSSGDVDSDDLLQETYEGYLGSSPMKKPKDDIETYQGYLGSSPMKRPEDDSITVEPLGLTERERDAEIATIEAQLAEQEVATEDPSFLDRAGDFIGSALSNYRDSREGYRKKYVDHYGAGKGYFDSIYKESGGPVPQYYAAGDEVRDYYRSGVPMPGSAPTYSSSNAPTWETMADGIKEKVEDDQAERKRLMQLERFGSADNLSMDRLQTMQLKERLAKLKRDKAAQEIATQQSAYDNSTAREDAFNKNYYTGVSGDVPPSDEFSSIPQDYYDERNGNYDKPRRPSTHTEKQGASLFDLVENPDSTGDGYMIPELELIDKRKVPANTGYSGAEYQDPRVPSPMNTSIPSADEYSNTDSAKQMLKENELANRDYSGIDTVRYNLTEDQYDINSKVYGPEKVPQNVSDGDVIFRADTNMLYTVNDRGVLTDSYGRVADTETMQAFVDFQKGNDSEIKLSKYQPPSAASLEELNKRKAELTNKANEEIKINGQVSKETDKALSETNSKISKNKGQATQTGTAETRRWRDRETKRREDAEKETKKLMLKYKDAKRNANRLGIADFPSFEDWAKRQNIDPAKIDTQNYLKKGVNIGPAANEIIDTEGLGLTDDQLANSGELKSRLDGLDDGSAGGFDVDAVEQKGKAEVDTGGDGNGDGDGDEKFGKTKSFLSKLFGDLLDTDELKRMAILYLGSRAMGASHNGSLAWSGKYYLKRIENKDANHTARVKAAITSKLYTPASIELYKNSRKESDLDEISGGGATYNLKGNNKEFYSAKAGKAITGIQVERTRADGSKDTYYTFNPSDPKKPGYMQPLSLDWNQKNASRVRGTNEYIERTNKAAKALAGSLNEMITINKDEDNNGTLEMQRLTVGSDTLSLQVAKFAEDRDLNLGAAAEVSRLAFEAMKKDLALHKKLTVGNIKPYLNAAMIRQRSGIGAELFESADGKTPNTLQVINFNEKLANAGKNKIKDVTSGKGQVEMIDKYRDYFNLFQADMAGTPTSFKMDGVMVSISGNKSNIQAAENNLKKGESLFMAWVRREIAGLNP